tara:strand:+ start:457 stop:2409 length:1953 start_codon:yes stop_codon:yes gene_type:complete
MESTHFIDKRPDRYEALLELEKRSIDEMNVEEICKVVEIFEDAWDLRRCDHRDARELGYRQFIHPDFWDSSGPIAERIDIRAIKAIKDKQRRYLINLRGRMGVLGIKSKQNEDGFTLLKRVNNVGKQLKDGFENVRRHWNVFERTVNPTAEPLVTKFSDPLAMDDEEIEKCTPYQKSIIHSLDEAHRRGFRRYRDHCYEEIKSPFGYGTRAWRPKYEILAFVHSLAPKDEEFENWRNFTSKGGCYRDVASHMTNCVDPQFPAIEKRRHVWSFKNGLFIGKEDGPQIKGHPTCKFYPYDSADFRALDPTIIACKYFEQDFPAHYTRVERWYDIPTPNFDTILHYQGFEEEVCRWAYVMGGRLCFDVGELDKWQVIPFFKGIARSGKSTLINNVFSKFYDTIDVRTLGNNIERKFGLSAIMEALLFIAPEVKGDLALEQAEFQSLVSGEGIAVNVKNKVAVSLPNWKVPGVLGGNEVPNWNDKSGSVLRRILPWNFTKQVQEADPHLDKKLENELPAILLKCVRAYLDYSERYNGRDIWNVVPKYFKKIQDQVAQVANTLHHFLNSVRVMKGDDKFVPEEVFVQAYNSHCSRSIKGKKPDLWNPDFYVGPFSAYGITVKNESVTYNGKTYAAQSVFYGVDVVEEELSVGNNH